MLTCTKLQGNRRQFLALTGLTLPEFQLLLTAFTRSYERLYLPDRTLVGRPRQRFPGGGRKGVLYRPEQKLLFMLVYLKTYPLQALMGELFGLSQPRVNYWIGCNYRVDLTQRSVFCRRAVDLRALCGISKRHSILR